MKAILFHFFCDIMYSNLNTYINYMDSLINSNTFLIEKKMLKQCNKSHNLISWSFIVGVYAMLDLCFCYG